MGSVVVGDDFRAFCIATGVLLYILIWRGIKLACYRQIVGRQLLVVWRSIGVSNRHSSVWRISFCSSFFPRKV